MDGVLPCLLPSARSDSSFSESASSTFIHIRKSLLKLPQSGNWAILTSILSDLITFLKWISYIRLSLRWRIVYFSFNDFMINFPKSKWTGNNFFAISNVFVVANQNIFLENFSNESNTATQNIQTCNFIKKESLSF